MQTERPPTIDPTAAQRWSQHLPHESPWLHEEVARRMEERLQWIVKKPQHWVHWAALQGGTAAQSLLARRYPQSQCHVMEHSPDQQRAARERLQPRWWQSARWSGPELRFSQPAAPVQMVWANMALHMHADPQSLIRQWHQLLEVDGFLMFSCFGPDTMQELRRLYAAMGWPAPSHEFTDMHDWGDMLVGAGFAEPVMDMERITLSYSSPDTLLTELRALGRNLHPQRFAGLRGRGWLDRFKQQLQAQLGSTQESGRLQISFEIIYGHAFKPAPRVAVASQSSITLDDMRQALGVGKSPRPR